MKIAIALAVFLFALGFGRQARADRVGDQWDLISGSGVPGTTAAGSRRHYSSRVLARVTGGRPAHCPPVRWCGCWLQYHFGLTDQTLWNARRWAGVGRPASAGCVNCIAVLTRGKRGGHVGIVEGYDERGNPVIKSGNHNNAVGVGTYPRSRVIAYRYL